MFCAAQQSAGPPLTAPTPGLDRGGSEFETGWGWGADGTPCRAQVHHDGCPGTRFLWGNQPPAPQCWLILVLLWSLVSPEWAEDPGRPVTRSIPSRFSG